MRTFDAKGFAAFGEQIAYALLGTATGVVVGLVCGVFGRGIDALSAFGMSHFNLYVWFLPAVGLLTAAISAAVALTLALLASLGGGLMDSLVCGLINLVMGIPHMLLLILISYSLGKGFRGVAAGIALTHWASLTRLLRAEILQIRESPYVRISEKLGKKPWWIAWNHIVPQVSRQFVTGLILLFPHAILHEAGVTFLGFGLSSEQPAIGVILSESMSYLITGKWWLALFPGAALVLVTLGFQAIGQSLGRLMDPGSAHE